MPNIAVHLLLARRVLHEWRAHPGQAPFDAGSAEAVEAFLYGSVAPDAGYFPGGDRLFSELAHLWRTGDLANALAPADAGQAQRAYAWGWAAHVLADRAIHPLINEASGLAVHGTRGRPLSSTDDVRTHMRVEYGLDAAVAARHPEVEAMRIRRALPAAVVRGIESALRSVWGWAPPAESIAASHARAPLAVRLCALTNRVHTARWRRRPFAAFTRVAGAALAPGKRWMPAGWNASPAAAAILRPLPAPAWLVDAVDEVADGFAAWLASHRVGDSPSLPNHDLITGEPEREHDRPPRTVDALRDLAARGGFRPMECAVTG